MTVQRSVLPEAVRLTLELDGEVPYQHERLDNPSRLFFDLKGAAPVATLQDSVLTYPDDVLRQVRLGTSSATNTTRVVLDLDGVARYSVFTLYNPYRVVVDLERHQTAKRGPAVLPVSRPSATRAAVAPPPVPPAATARTAIRPAAPSKTVARQAELTLTLAPPMPVTTRPFVAEPPGARVVRETEVVRLAPETAIVSRDLEVAGKPVSQEALAAAPSGAVRSSGRAEAKPSARRAPLPKAPPASTTKTDTAAEELAAELARANGLSVAPPDSQATVTHAAAEGPSAVELSDVPSSASAAPVSPSANANGGFSLARQLGLGISRIVIDPGHGGHDPGAHDKGLSEAELVLDVVAAAREAAGEAAGRRGGPDPPQRRRSSRSRSEPRSPTGSRPTCSCRSTRTRAATSRRAASRPTS